MSVSYKIENFLRQYLFRTKYKTYVNNIVCDYTNNDLYKLAIVTNCNIGETCFTPTCMQKRILSRGTLLLPLLVRYEKNARTIDKALVCLLSNSYCNYLTKVTLKGTVYYGAPGLILYDDFTPMLVSGIRGKVNSIYIEDAELIVYVNPRVFEADDNVSKYIAKKIIPFICSYRAFYAERNGSIHYTVPSTDQSVRVILEDISHMIVTPKLQQTLDITTDIKNYLRGEVLS